MSSAPSNSPVARSGTFYLVAGAALYVFIESYPLLSPILLSFLLILLISLAVNPLITRIRSVLTGGRTLATGLAAAALIAAVALTGWASFGPVTESIAGLAEQVPAYWQRLQKPLIRIEKQAAINEEVMQAEVNTEIAEAATSAGEQAAAQRISDSVPPARSTEEGSLRSGLGEALRGILGRFTSLAFNAAQILIVLLTVFFGVIFTLMNPRPIFGTMFALAPERHHERLLVILQRIGAFIPAWVGATLLGMITIGVLVFLLMWPIFGIKDALALGLIAGILEVVPFIGPVLSAVPALLLALGQGDMTWVWVALAYLAIQGLENNVILPTLMARGMKLHPVAVLFSTLLCVAAFGVLGVLVAAPLVAIVDIVHDELFRKRYLPNVTDDGLDTLARRALHERRAPDD